MSKTINLGKVSLTPKGKWEAGIKYEYLDVVNHNDKMWISRAENINEEPNENGAYWCLALASGDVNADDILANICITDSSLNMLNTNTILYGKYMTNDSDAILDGEYNLTDFIAVSEGQNITFQYYDGIRMSVALAFVTAFDKNREIIADLGAENVDVYTVPESVKYIRCTLSKQYSGNSKYLPAIVDSIAIYEYFNYAEKKQMVRSEKLIGDDLGESLVKLENLDFVKQYNYFDPDHRENVFSHRLYDGRYIKEGLYFISHYIRVKPNTQYNFFIDSNPTDAVACCQYDINKKYIKSLGTVTGASSVVTDSNTRYIKVSLSRVDRFSFKVLKDESSEITHDYPNTYIPKSLVRDGEIPFVFLPDTIKVLKNKTVDIYNNSICPTADKYRFFWTCDIGRAYGRKFSIENNDSVTAGEYPLTLKMYNDSNLLVFEKTVTVKLLARDTNILGAHICTIGDELSKKGAWMKQLREMTSNNITFVGSQTVSENISGELMSGWSTEQFVYYANYLEDGVEKQNPCWKNYDFYWKGAEYVSGIYGSVAFCIFLGRNNLIRREMYFNDGMDEFDFYERYISNIRTMIDKMIESRSDVPIFVILPVCWSCQDGIIESARTEEIFEGRREEEMNYKIIRGAKMLYDYIQSSGLQNVHCVPVTALFDARYNYGAAEENVNSNLDVSTIAYGGTRVPSEKGSAQIAESFLAYMVDAMGDILY